jgi:hypothetical protein
VSTASCDTATVPYDEDDVPDLDFSPMFTPVTVRGMTLANRFVLPAMQRKWCVNGEPMPQLIEYYRRRVLGGSALVITEACAVDHPRATQHGRGPAPRRSATLGLVVPFSTASMAQRRDRGRLTADGWPPCRGGDEHGVWLFSARVHAPGLISTIVRRQSFRSVQGASSMAIARPTKLARGRTPGPSAQPAARRG